MTDNSDDETVTIQCTRNEARALADLIDREIQEAPPRPSAGKCDFMDILEASIKKAAELRDRLRTESATPDAHRSDRKMYLGDGVYADMEGPMIVLTTEGSLDAANRICLEPKVLDALLLWVDAMRRRGPARAI